MEQTTSPRLNQFLRNEFPREKKLIALCPQKGTRRKGENCFSFLSGKKNNTESLSRQRVNEFQLAINHTSLRQSAVNSLV